jgi:D-alanyl-D-alanine dipeptidase
VTTNALRRIAFGLVGAVVACQVARPPAPRVAETIEEGPATTYMTTSVGNDPAPGSIAGSVSASDSASVSDSASASASGLPSIPTAGLVDLSPSRFGGVDVCLRTTGADTNACARVYGVSNGMGGLERPCQLEATAVTALAGARLAMKKANPNLELLVMSSFRPPGHQQCLWLDGSDGKKCSPNVCGARDGKGKPLPCKKYDLANPIWAHVYDHCKHVDMRAIDVCAYDTTKVKLDANGVLDMTKVEDCSSVGVKGPKLQPGQFFHPCGCLRVGWTKDVHEGSKRAKVVFQHGGVDEQQTMIKALREAGFKDDVSNEWWHFQLAKK